MTGTWRAKVYTDPKANPIAADRVPGRGLRARAARARSSSPTRRRSTPQEPGTIKLAGRYLYGAAGRRPRRRGRDRRQAVDQGRCRASPATASASPTSRSSPCASRSKACPPPTPRARPTIAVRLPALPQTSRPLEADVDPAAARIGRPHHRAHPHAARRPEGAAHRHQAAVRRRPGRRKASPRASRRSCSAPTARPSTAKGLKWELLRLDQRCQWYSRDGTWNYEPVTQHARASPPARSTPPPARPATIAAKVDWGRYRLEVSAAPTARA